MLIFSLFYYKMVHKGSDKYIMKNIVDELNEKIINLKSPVVVGLDPVIEKIPNYYKKNLQNAVDKLSAVADIFFNFNKDIIDSICDIVPAVKPQMAFYEMYGEAGIRAFINTIKYAKQKGLLVIDDAKRNDIGNTAKAYAKGHLGKVDCGDGNKISVFDADFITVSPYLGLDSIEPFIDECKENNKGIFVLVKTSNPTSADIQDKIDQNGAHIYESVAKYVKQCSEGLIGETNYTPIGAVVGATFPEEASTLRKIMDNNIFLVPGYGAQGASAKDIVNCFNNDGLGALVNASRSIIFAYMKNETPETCSKESYQKYVRESAIKMRDDIVQELRNTKNNLKY